MRLELVEPRLERKHRFAPQAEDAYARVVRNALVRDEACLEEDPQVPAHGRSGRAGSDSQLAGSMRPVSEELDHTPPRGIGKSREDPFRIFQHI